MNFLDSNVFIYMLDNKDARKRALAAGIVRDAADHATGVISTQVVQETLNVLTRKLAPAVTPLDTRRFLDGILGPLWRLAPSMGTFHRALDVQGRWSLHFYDALIVAAALEAGCDTLYTEDLSHGQRFGDLAVVNPFL